MINININKCKVLSIAHNKKDIIYYYYSLNTNDENFDKLEHVHNFCDLQVIMDSKLKFDNLIYDKIHVANKILGIINRNFKGLDKLSFILLYKGLVRSYLKFAHCVE